MVVKVVSYIIMALVILGIVMVMFNLSIEDVQSGIEQQFTSPDLVTMPREPDITIDATRQSGFCLYDVKIEDIKLKYVGEGKDPDGNVIAKLDVMPLLSFKDEDIGGEVFILEEENDFEKSFSIEFTSAKENPVITRIPPVKKMPGETYIGQMREGQTFAFTTEEQGNFTVYLRELKKRKTLVGTETGPCHSYFLVGCGVSLGFFGLKDWNQCGVDKSECERYTDVCGGTIYVKMLGGSGNYQEMNCEANVANVEIAVDGGTGDAGKVGEELTLTLWRNTGCVQNRIQSGVDKTKLLQECLDDFLGAHTFVEDPLNVDMPTCAAET